MKIDLNRFTLVLILALGLFWRFWNFSERLVFNQDQSRDVILANYFWKEGIWPLLGPTSSAGPFNFGGIYYYVVMILVKIPGIWGPWIGMTCLMSLTMLLAYFLGKEVLNNRLGLMMAFLVADSPLLIRISGDMLNTVLVWPFSLLAVYFLAKLIRIGRVKFGFGIGIVVGLAAAMHFQAFGLLVLGVVGGWFCSRKMATKIKAWFGFGLGFWLPFLPNLVFDLRNGGRWIKSVVEFYLVGVHKFYVPIRWLTEIKDFWPKTLGQIFGGEVRLGYFLVVLGMVVLIWQRKRLPMTIKAVLIGLIGVILEVRYYSGSRSWEYFIFTYPLLLVLVAWVLWLVAEKVLPKKMLIILGVGVVVFLNRNCIILVSQKSQVGVIREIKQQIENHKLTKEEKPGFQIYQKEDANMLSLPLLYWFLKEGKISDNGEVVVVAITKKGYDAAPLLGNETGAFKLDEKLVYSWNGINYPGAK